MKKEEITTLESVEGAQTKSTSKYQLTISELRELVKDSELLELLIDILENEDLKVKQALNVARYYKKQIKLEI